MHNGTRLVAAVAFTVLATFALSSCRRRGVYYAPGPVYVQPQRVYVQPQPVYVQPQPVYVQQPQPTTVYVR